MNRDESTLQTATRLTHAGRKGKDHHGPVNPP